MENANQIAYLMFAAFILGLVIKYYFEFNHQHVRPELKGNWTIALFFLLISSLCIAVGSTGLHVFLFVGHVLAVVSLLKMGLFFRAIHRPITPAFNRYIDFITLFFIGLFGFLFIEKSPYLYRFYLISAAIVLITMWHIDEIVHVLTKEKTIHIIAILYLKLALLILCFIRVITAFDVFEGHIEYVYQEEMSGLLARLILTSLNLATFVMVGGYISETTLLAEKSLVAQLNDKIRELKNVTNERDEVKGWLMEREQLIESLIKSQKMAETGVLSASIAHELSQPLCAIQMNAQCLHFLMRENNDDDTKKALLERIIADNARASEIIASLKLIFTSSKNQFELVSLDDLIQKVGLIVLPSAKMKNIAIHFELAFDETVFLCVNEFQQVIMNLLSNAIQALEHINDKQREIHIITSKKRDVVRIVISDNGEGIPRALGNTIFDLMKTSKAEGMGIGLWLSRHIIKRHDGVLFYENKLTGGVAFIIEMPIKQ